MPDFYLSVGLVDENFINELSPVLLRCSIKLSEDSRKGLLKEGLEGSKRRKRLFREACKAENSEGVVEGGLDFKILVGCGHQFWPSSDPSRGCKIINETLSQSFYAVLCLFYINHM